VVFTASVVVVADVLIWCPSASLSHWYESPADISAFNSVLKLPVAGAHIRRTGRLGNVGYVGYYWTRSVVQHGPMGCLLAYKDLISFLIIRKNWPKCFVHYRNIHFSIPIIFNILHFLDSVDSLIVTWFIYSKRVLIIFAPEQRFLFILAWFSVRFPLFSYDLKTIFAIYCILTKVTNT
jgi:hypothetical protein